MRGRGLIAVLIGVLAVAVIGAGCGGDGGSDATAGDQPSKALFIKKAEAVCERSHIEEIKEDQEEFIEAHGGNIGAAFDDIDSITEYVDTIAIPHRERLIDELSELGAPSGDEEKVDEILAAYEEGIEVAEEDPERVVVGRGVFQYATDLAKEYGLEECRS